MTETASSPGPTHAEGSNALALLPSPDFHEPEPDRDRDPATPPSKPLHVNLFDDDDDDEVLSDVPTEAIETPTNGVNGFSDGASQPQTPVQPNGIPEAGVEDSSDDAAPVEDLANGHDATPSPGDSVDGRPAKRRRVTDASASSTLPKPVSPPWKKIEAEGPTSFTENGRRKSGRINTVPLELQPQGKKRLTRGALHGLQGSPPARTRYASANGHATTNATQVMSNGGKKPPPKAVPARTAAKQAPKSAPKPKPVLPLKRAPASESRPTRASTRRRTPSPPAQPTRHSTRTRRPTRGSMDEDLDATSGIATSQESPNRTRIKLRVRQTTIPFIHFDQSKGRPKLGPTFEEYWERAGTIPVEQGGLFASEDGPAYTDDMARKDADAVLRIEAAVEPGGILSQERSSLFVPEPAEQPPRQWAHADHMVKTMSHFRRLLLIEQQRHRATAKKIAEACRDEWLRRQPKTAEQIEAEARELWVARYRLVAKTLFGTWENVRAEVNRRRLEEWEAEEQRRVKAALNEAVSMSELKLQARRAQLDSDMSDEDEDSSIDGDDADDEEQISGDDSGDRESEDGESGSGDDDNMSSSSDEEETEELKVDVGDEKLSQDQLRAKYADLPELNIEELANDTGREGDDDETSDESIDMDSDISSDMDSDDGSDEDEEEEEDDDNGRGSALLGFFFGKKELKKLGVDEENEDEEGGDAAKEVVEAEDIDMDATQPSQTPLAEGSQEPPKDYSVETNGYHDAEDEIPEEDEVSLIQPPAFYDREPTVEGPADSLLSKVAGNKTTLANGVRTLRQDSDAEEEEMVLAPIQADADASEPLASKQTDDVEMADASMRALPEFEVTAAATDEKPTSPETELPTNPPSPERSQSPRTSETKPSEVGTSPAETDNDKIITSRSATPPLPTGPKTEIPFLLRGTLREYQHYGLDWLAGLYANNTNGILADEMGLGKTIQTIALLAHLACHHEVWGPHLVIVPTSVMLNWEMEFKKWCPGFKILSYYGTQEERKRKRQGWNTDDIWNVCITSYQLVLQDQQVFKRRRWHYMILDEAHNIKNFKSQRWQTLLGFNTHSRLLLTGTPLQNNLTELWSLLFFLMPSENGVGGFADLQEFHDWFAKPESQILESGREQMDDEARAIIAKLHKVLRPYLLRRLKADVEKQMPAKYEHVEWCRLSKRQRELYDGFLARTDTRETLSSGNYLSIINCLMQLRKVCNHPDLFVDRPIMTSFPMQRSVASHYQHTDALVKKRLEETPMNVVSLNFLNLIPTAYEGTSHGTADRISQLSSHRVLMDLREAQKIRAQNAYTNLDPSTVESNIVYLENKARWGRFEELQHCVYLNALRRQQRPIYGSKLVEFLTLGVDARPQKPRPKVPQRIMSWFEEESHLLHTLVPTIDERAAAMQTTIQKFACVTPAVVTKDMDQFILGYKGVEAFEDMNLVLSRPIRWTPFMPKEAPLDPWHESRMRLSIQFPDRRLLQFDCGKLQALDKLLRKLQAGGHRALIFTQMTKVLDILEQFLNIHGHKYLRLDGATKVEQRQILTDRFNHDPRILCFILSTRSGGLGINLTGADTVIFYDQDWNPAMDKQCQDRCHRIGQTRDVHIYRLVSEHTIEANILRKASQKQMLDDVVIQEGEFTTDYFNKLSVRDVMGEDIALVSDGIAAANAAMDRVLGGVDGNDQDDRRVGKQLAQAEDREDVAAAQVAEKEIIDDEADFSERPAAGSGTSSARQGTPREDVPESAGPGRSGLGLFVESAEDVVEAEPNAWGEPIHTIDDYMLKLMAVQLSGTPLELPKDKKKSKKKGKDTRKR